MASYQYTRNITPDPPEPPPEPMTRQKKWENFWFYYKWHVIVGAVVLLMVGMLVKDVVFQTQPDYTIAVLTRSAMPTSVAQNLQAGLAPLCDDRNGDGKVTVQVLEYVIDNETTADPQTQMANVTKLMGDVQTGESMLFLTNDVDYFEKQYAIFAYNDGQTPPENETPDAARLGVAWKDCHALASLDLGAITLTDGTQQGAVQDYLQNFTLLRRVYTGTKIDGDKKAAPYYQSAVALFSQWTA